MHETHVDVRNQQLHGVVGTCLLVSRYCRHAIALASSSRGNCVFTASISKVFFAVEGSDDQGDHASWHADAGVLVTMLITVGIMITLTSVDLTDMNER